MRLAYGAVQRKGTLDHLIERLAERPPARLDPPRARRAAARAVRAALPAAARPTTRSSPTPSSWPRRSGRAGHGLVNAVLRRAAREGAGALLGGAQRRHARAGGGQALPPASGSRGCGGRSSAPSEARALMALDNEPAEVALRANTLVDRRRDARAASCPCARTATPRLPEALVLEEPFDVHGSPLWQRGRVPRAVARGDARRARARPAAGRAGARPVRRAGRQEHPSRRADGRPRRGRGGRARPRAAPARWRAPRSGCAPPTSASRSADAALERAEGARVRPRARRSAVLGPRHAAGARRPALARDAARRSPQMARAQAAILAAGAGALRPGGVLVYSTCTISPTENERLIAAFLDSHADFGLDDLAASSRHVADAQARPRAPADAAPPRPHGRLLHRPAAAELSDGGRAGGAGQGRRSTSGRSAPTAASRGCARPTCPGATAASTACTASSSPPCAPTAASTRRSCGCPRPRS